MPTRRGNHEGTIYKRKDGRWEAKITLPDGTRKPLYGKTRQEAAQKLTQAQHDLAKGLPVVAEKQTVDHYLERWLEGIRMEAEPATYRSYRATVHFRILPFIGKHRLASLDAQQITGLYSQLQKKGYKPNTIQQTHNVLTHALNEAVNTRLLQRNEAKYAKKPRIKAKAKSLHVWTEDQANQFLAFIAGHRYEALYVLALTVGMRESELLGLHWRNVEMKKKLLHVEQAVKYGEDATKDSLHLGTTKTEGSTHTIHLSDTAIDALVAHRTRQKAEKLAVGLDVWQERDLVFPDPLGNLYAGPALYKQFIRLVAKTDLPRIRFHDLRHTCATIHLARGIPVKQVSEMLGHSDITITLRIYGHVIPAMNEQAAALMDDIFGRRQA